MIAMIMSYEEFVQRLNTTIETDQSFFDKLLIKIVRDPHRFTGVFRLSNVKNKLIQYVTQSREIKFGNFMEEIITEYIQRMGYRNLEKRIQADSQNAQYFNVDQLFIKDNSIYLIEQKIRDDHDSTKKVGQFDNFRKKYLLLGKKHPEHEIIATMWFIDDSLVKNKNYYLGKIANETSANLKLSISYGPELFINILGNIEAWNEIYAYLSRNKAERDQESLDIPDFDTSKEIFCALLNLKKERPALFKKLISDDKTYVQLREELFPTGENLKKLLD